jgi:hypothetical protein
VVGLEEAGAGAAEGGPLWSVVSAAAVIAKARQAFLSAPGGLVGAAARAPFPVVCCK